MTYINQNVSLRIGGRKAPKMSGENFMCLINEKFPKLQINHLFLYNLLGYDNDYNTKLLSKFFNDCEKVDFSFENIESVDYIFGLTPNYVQHNLVCVTNSGIPYIPFCAYGDWERPLLVIFYWDGKSFRGYVPTKGNTFNRKANSAFGNNTIVDMYDDDDDDNRILCDDVTEKDLKNSDEEFLKSQGVEVDEETCDFDIDLDFDGCIEDFESRVVAF